MDCVIEIAIYRTISSFTQNKVIMLGSYIVIPSSGICKLGRRCIYRATRQSLADQSKTSCIFGVFLKAPPLIVIIICAFNGLSVRPQTILLCITSAYLGRSSREQFYTRAFTSVHSLAHNAIIILLLRRIGFGINDSRRFGLGHGHGSELPLCAGIEAIDVYSIPLAIHGRVQVISRSLLVAANGIEIVVADFATCT